jgi:uncharacterized protein
MRRHEFEISTAERQVRALLLQPGDARWLLLLGHGAGAGMHHPFMADIAERLADRCVATLRYEFPYMSAGSRRPDPASLLEQVCRDIAAWAAVECAELRIAAGGKSMGGRMTSQAHAAAPLPAVARLVFLGFPLHPAGRPAVARAAHLYGIDTPMLFVQGGRDRLAELPLVRDVCTRLGGRATLHLIAEADHGFSVRRRSGYTRDAVLDEIGAVVADWLDSDAHSHHPSTDRTD